MATEPGVPETGGESVCNVGSSSSSHSSSEGGGAGAGGAWTGGACGDGWTRACCAAAEAEAPTVLTICAWIGPAVFAAAIVDDGGGPAAGCARVCAEAG